MISKVRMRTVQLLLVVLVFALVGWLACERAGAEGISSEYDDSAVEVVEEKDGRQEALVPEDGDLQDEAIVEVVDDESSSQGSGDELIVEGGPSEEAADEGGVEMQAADNVSKEVNVNISLGKQYSRKIIGYEYDSLNFTLSTAASITVKLTTSMSTAYVWVDGSNLSQGINYDDGSGKLKAGNVTKTISLPKGKYSLGVYEEYGKSGSYSVRVDKKGAASISGASISSIAEQAYTGKAVKPTPTVKHGSVALKSGTDYTVSYKNNTNIGTATVTVTGKGSYTGTKSRTFKIISKGTYFRDASPIDKNNHGVEVDWMGTSGISTGWQVSGGREFRGLRDVTRCDFAAFLYRLGDLADNGSRDDSIALSNARVKSVLATVSDCTTSTDHAAEIAWLVDSGISRGWADEGATTVSFHPMAKVARQDMAAFLYRFADIQDDDVQNQSLAMGGESVTFADVESGDEANHASEVEWLASVGVTKGWSVGGTYEFRGRKTVARQDMAAFMYRLNTYLGC